MLMESVCVNCVCLCVGDDGPQLKKPSFDVMHSGAGNPQAIAQAAIAK